jgi:5'-3' exoribonuclease 1
MGVKHFYMWYSKQFEQCLHKTPPSGMDILCIDMNGLFHYCAQEVFEYGVFAKAVPSSREYQGLLGRMDVKTTKIRMTKQKLLDLFRKVCQKIEELRKYVQPRKSLVLCVDGVAGLGKMNQQRQRRFRAALKPISAWPNSTPVIEMELDEPPNFEEFHSNYFTPGTWVMDDMTRYVDWYIRLMQTTHPAWKALEVIFSNEKVPGEGEHKIMDYLRKYAQSSDKICIYGLDADLVMLAMMLPFDHVYIGREADKKTFDFVNVHLFQKEVVKCMDWRVERGDHSFQASNAVHDFIVLCFLVGNDFLPTLPSLAIIEGALETMMTKYKKIGKEFGHLTGMYRGKPRLRVKTMALFFREMALVEQSMIFHKYTSTTNFAPDLLVKKYLTSRKAGERFSIQDKDWKQFRQDYFTHHFPPHTSPVDVMRRYLDGMNWVLNYYHQGIPDWTWFFPYLYAPFFTDFLEDPNMMDKYTNPNFEKHEPVPAFLQLFMVLPQTHKALWPTCLQTAVDEEETEWMNGIPDHWASYFPSKVVLDKGGKRKDWEAIIRLVPSSLDDFRTVFDICTKDRLTEKEKRRNQQGKTFSYKFDESFSPRPFLSIYGNVENCQIRLERIMNS